MKSQSKRFELQEADSADLKLGIGISDLWAQRLRNDSQSTKRQLSKAENLTDRCLLIERNFCKRF